MPNLHAQFVMLADDSDNPGHHRLVKTRQVSGWRPSTETPGEPATGVEREQPRPIGVPLSDASGVCCLASEGQMSLRVSSIRFGFGIGV